MMKIEFTTKFKKDLKVAKKRGYDLQILYEVVEIIVSGDPLPDRYGDYPLIGDYKGCRECHLKPDWLLIYQIINNELILLLTRTGTHSDLFGE